MTTIYDMMKRLEAVDVMELAAESIEDTKSDMVEWQKEQLFAGKKETGGSIKPFYRPATIKEKKKKGQPTDRVTLRDKGPFYNAVFVDVRQTTFIIDSADRKTPFLVNRYGESIFGLGGIFKIGYISDVRPVWEKKIEDKTGLTFV